jgi:hypothetical protein
MRHIQGSGFLSIAPHAQLPAHIAQLVRCFWCERAFLWYLEILVHRQTDADVVFRVFVSLGKEWSRVIDEREGRKRREEGIYICAETAGTTNKHS